MIPQNGRGNRLAGHVLAALLPCAILLSACSQPPAPKDNYYRLEGSPPPAARAAPLLPGILEIGRPTADGVFGQRAIAYSERKRSHLVQHYHYQNWIDPPAVMIQRRMTAYMRDAGLVATAATPEMHFKADFVLTSALRRLERIVGDKPAAVVELEIGLRRIDPEKPILLKTYAVEIPAQDDSMDAAIVAFRAALDEILAAFAKDIATEISVR